MLVIYLSSTFDGLSELSISIQLFDGLNISLGVVQFSTYLCVFRKGDVMRKMSKWIDIWGLVEANTEL